MRRRVAWRERRGHLRLECRECEVICEWVISPWYCLKGRCVFIYAFKEGESTYFGCLCKVFVPELDLGAFLDETGRPGRRADPYGPLRVARTPRPQCRVTIEHAYDAAAVAGSCCNPTFFHHPLANPDESIRLTTRPPDADPSDRN